KEGEKGINSHGFTEGQKTLADGKYGKIQMDALRLEGVATGRAGLALDEPGGMANVDATGAATLIGLHAETAALVLGKPGKLAGTISADGDARVGAYAAANGLAVASLKEVRLYG